jgi:hypothetical protein
MWAPPFAVGEQFAREAVHKLERKGRRENLYSKEATTSGGGCRGPATTPPEKEDTVESVTMINGDIPSALMG